MSDETSLFVKDLYKPRTIAQFKADLEVFLKYYQPISLEEVEDIVDMEEGSFVFNGIEFWYEDDYKAKFKRMSSEKEEKVYIIEFEAENEEDGGISFEIWEDGDSECFYYKKIDNANIEILSLGY